MHSTRHCLFATIGVLLVAAVAHPPAQTVKATRPGTGGSPRETVEWTLEGATITIAYGRPFAKGRRIFGGLHPYGTIWRTGADEATTLTTSAPLFFGRIEVPPGTYSLFTLLGEVQWKLIVNRQTGQWGTVYDEQQDVARITMRVQALPSPVEQHTIAIDKTATGGALRVEWDHWRARRLPLGRRKRLRSQASA
jgi:hypothetical protein